MELSKEASIGIVWRVVIDWLRRRARTRRTARRTKGYPTGSTTRYLLLAECYAAKRCNAGRSRGGDLG